MLVFSVGVVGVTEGAAWLAHRKSWKETEVMVRMLQAGDLLFTGRAVVRNYRLDVEKVSNVESEGTKIGGGNGEDFNNQLVSVGR
ncbi:hypothetical protein [Granulicella sp. dw_53]|uniref:hypothetical protein n=1 Tax=Granulicella sp. dw_53 TaxID=2719792 RepID=UPI001BD3B373|nr:hypothetical protein [Granulicella sp. dw_53]